MIQQRSKDSMSSDKKLTRSVDNRMIAGVVGGLAEYFNIDPTIMRIIAIILTLMTGVGFGILIYFILWIVMPQELA